MRYDPGFAAQREAELAASLGELGVTDLRILGLPDGGCDRAHPEPAIARIAAAMREVRPDTIVTFGPDGITGHPDHRAVSRWTTEAWRRTGQGRLLYAALSEEHVRRFAHVAEQLDLFGYCGERGPATVPTEQLALHRVPRGADLDRKRRALAAHATQTEAVAGLVGEAVYRDWSAPESFRLPAPDEVASCPLPAWMSDQLTA